MSESEDETLIPNLQPQQFYNVLQAFHNNMEGMVLQLSEADTEVDNTAMLRAFLEQSDRDYAALRRHVCRLARGAGRAGHRVESESGINRAIAESTLSESSQCQFESRSTNNIEGAPVPEANQPQYESQSSRDFEESLASEWSQRQSESQPNTDIEYSRELESSHPQSEYQTNRDIEESLASESMHPQSESQSTRDIKESSQPAHADRQVGSSFVSSEKPNVTSIHFEQDKKREILPIDIVQISRFVVTHISFNTLLSRQLETMMNLSSAFSANNECRSSHASANIQHPSGVARQVVPGHVDTHKEDDRSSDQEHQGRQDETDGRFDHDRLNGLDDFESDDRSEETPTGPFVQSELYEAEVNLQTSSHDSLSDGTIVTIFWSSVGLLVERNEIRTTYFKPACLHYDLKHVNSQHKYSGRTVLRQEKLPKHKIDG